MQRFNCLNIRLKYGPKRIEGIYIYIYICISVIDGKRNLKILAKINSNTETTKIRLILAINIFKHIYEQSIFIFIYFSLFFHICTISVSFLFSF